MNNIRSNGLSNESLNNRGRSPLSRFSRGDSALSKKGAQPINEKPKPQAVTRLRQKIYAERFVRPLNIMKARYKHARGESAFHSQNKTPLVNKTIEQEKFQKQLNILKKSTL